MKRSVQLFDHTRELIDSIFPPASLGERYRMGGKEFILASTQWLQSYGMGQILDGGTAVDDGDTFKLIEEANKIYRIFRGLDQCIMCVSRWS